MTARASSACLLAVALLAARAAPGAQSARVGVSRQATSTAWLAAVRARTPGAVDDAVMTISRWSPGAAFAAVRTGVRATTDPAVLQRALILHTDTAIYERAAFEDGHRVRPGRGDAAPRRRARAVGDLPRSPHWDIGREIAAALVTRPGGRPMVQRWYRATARRSPACWAEIDVIEGIERIRYTSPHPKDMREDVIRAHAELDASASTSTCRCSRAPAILKAMRRTYDRDRYMQRVAMIREHVPDWR